MAERVRVMSRGEEVTAHARLRLLTCRSNRPSTAAFPPACTAAHLPTHQLHTLPMRTRVQHGADYFLSPREGAEDLGGWEGRVQEDAAPVAGMNRGSRSEQMCADGSRQQQGLVPARQRSMAMSCLACATNKTSTLLLGTIAAPPAQPSLLEPPIPPHMRARCCCPGTTPAAPAAALSRPHPCALDAMEALAQQGGQHQQVVIVDPHVVVLHAAQHLQAGNQISRLQVSYHSAHRCWIHT